MPFPFATSQRLVSWGQPSPPDAANGATTGRKEKAKFPK
jgi:hypothetical protein